MYNECKEEIINWFDKFIGFKKSFYSLLNA